MSYIKIENGIVVQKQPYPEKDFIEAGDSVICGMLYDGNIFSNPPKPPQTNQDEIDGIEARITYRRIREAILTPGGKAWLQTEENKIESIRNRP